MKLPILVLGVLLGSLSLQEISGAPDGRMVQTDEDRMADSLARSYRDAVHSLKTPELEQRMEARRRIQKSGYCHTLAAVVGRDGLGALLSYIRMRLHLEFTLPNDQLYAYFPNPIKEERIPGVPGFTTFGSPWIVVPLEEDRTIPDDPWKRE